MTGGGRWVSSGKPQPPIYRAAEAPAPDVVQRDEADLAEHERRNAETVERLEQEMLERREGHFCSPTRKSRCGCGATIVWLASGPPPPACSFCGAEVQA